MLSTLRRHFSIFLTDGFSLLAFTSFTAPLRIANEVLGYRAYSWNIVTDDGSVTRTSCGLRLDADSDLDTVRRAKAFNQTHVFVLLPSEKSQAVPARLMSAIREAISRGAPVVGVGRGALILAEHGLLDGRRCAVHWRHFASSVEARPLVVFSRAYFEIDGPIHTCAGEASSFDLSLEIIKQDFGPEVRDRINEISLQGRPRSRSDRQAMSLHLRLERLGSPLLPVVKLMEQTISEPMTMDAISSTCRVSRRQIERLFRQQLGVTPQQFYRQIRIDRAQSLLENSGLALIDVAIATGFVSQSHFSRLYRSLIGCTPQESRVGRCRDGRRDADRGEPVTGVRAAA